MADQVDINSEVFWLRGALMGLAGFIAMLVMRFPGPFAAQTKATEQFAAGLQALAHAVDSSTDEQRRMNDRMDARLTRIEIALNLPSPTSLPSSPDRPPGG